MVTIDGLRFMVKTNENDDLFAVEYKYFNDEAAFGENLCITWSEGGRFLKLVALTDTYYKILSRSKKIDDNLYQFYFGEYPQLKVSRELSKELDKQFNEYNSYDCNLMLTGRVYTINHKIYPEYSFNNKKYIKYDNGWVQVLPIKWIIDVEKREKISSQVLTTSRYYNEWPLDEEIIQETYVSGKKFSVVNKIFRINDGELSYYNDHCSNLSGFDEENIYLPYGITSIKNSYFEKAKYLKIPKSVESFIINKICHINRLEVYDNIKIVGKLEISDWIKVHYESYNNLDSFLKIISHCIGSEMRPIRCFLVGPNISRKQIRDLRKKYSFIDNVYWQGEEENSLDKDDKPLELSDGLEKQEEKNKATLLLDKIYKYLENYPNYDKHKKEIDEMVNEYESTLDSIQASLTNQEDNLLSPSLDDTNNSFCMMLEGILSKLEKNSECYLMIEYIDKCIKSLNGELEDNNNLLLKTLGVYGTKSLEILKEPYKKDYYDKIMAILVDEKEKIQAFIEEYYNNNYGKKEFSYLDAGELESYLRRELYPLFKEITYAVNSEELSRDLQKEALTAMADMANSKIVESENEYIKSQISIISNISNELDSLINKNPLANRYREDKEIIMAYVSEDENESKDYLKDLISKCHSLKKYNQENDKLFMPEYIKKMNDSLKSVHSDNVKFLNVIKKLQSVIVALNLLELEVNNSIIQNNKINSYRVGRR